MYGGTIVSVVIIIVVSVLLSVLYKAPTCSDNVKNGTETGIDCGGACSRVCAVDTLSPVVLWSRILNISGDVYSVVAYVENPNVNSENNKATYQFRVYDAENKLIAMRDGETTIPKNKKFAVIETGILLNNRKPKTVDFKFNSFDIWQKNITAEPDISLEYGTISSTSTMPNLTGRIVNRSLQNIPKTELTVLVFDENENAIGVSRTFIDNLLKNTSQDFIFTWPKPLAGDISVVNVIYRFIKN